MSRRGEVAALVRGLFIAADFLHQHQNETGRNQIAKNLGYHMKEGAIENTVDSLLGLDWTEEEED